MKRYNRFFGGEWHFVPTDEWDGRVLKAHGYLYVTDWSEPLDLGPEWLPDSPEIIVRWVNPVGGLEEAGVLVEDGMVDVLWDFDSNGRYHVGIIDIAGWEEIEVLDWEASDE